MTKKERAHKWYVENKEKTREKARERAHKWYVENREKACEHARKWRAENKEKSRERERKRYRKLRLEKPEIYQEIFLRQVCWTFADFNRHCVQQQNRCFICGEKKKLNADHDHKRMLPRKPLCTRCNTFMGAIDSELLPAFLEYKRMHEPI